MTVRAYEENRDCLRSRAGGWTVGGEAVLHGYSIHRELVSGATWIQTMLLGVTGRMFSANEARLIEAMYVVTGYPDPRLWCNRVAALAGTARCSATASLSAGIASAEARLYGRQADYFAARTIEKARKIRADDGEEALKTFVETTLKRDRAIYGFGRPLTRNEERIPPIEKLSARLGVPPGVHTDTAFRIEEILKRRRMILNYGGYVMARLLDIGITPEEIYRIATLAFYTGLIPCYIEAYENQPGTFLPIACEDIIYEGKKERPLP